MSGHQTRTHGTTWIPRCQSLKSTRRKQNEPRDPMCPACIANMTLIAGGTMSSGGLTAFMMSKFCRKKKTNQTRGKQNENRRDRIENKRTPNESSRDRIGN